MLSMFVVYKSDGPLVPLLELGSDKDQAKYVSARLMPEVKPFVKPVSKLYLARYFDVITRVL